MARGWSDNEVAAVFAVIAGILFLVVGYSGARAVDSFFDLLQELFGTNPALRIAAIVLVSIASLGGVAVLLGAILLYVDRVRLGKILILLGAGAGIVSLIIFALLLVRRPGRVLAHEGVIPVVLGVVLSIAARWKAKPVPKR